MQSLSFARRSLPEDFGWSVEESGFYQKEECPTNFSLSPECASRIVKLKLIGHSYPLTNSYVICSVSAEGVISGRISLARNCNAPFAGGMFTRVESCSSVKRSTGL